MSETDETDEIAPPRNEPTEMAIACRNCGSLDVQQWCPVCGQENVPSALPVREILLGFLDEFLKFDTRIWTTLKALATRPGFLTNEYLEGRRVRYVAPIKLYLALSFVLFVLFTLFPQTEKKSDAGGEVTGLSSGINTAGFLLDTFSPSRPAASPSPTPVPSPTPKATPDPDETPDEREAREKERVRVKHADACADVSKSIQELSREEARESRDRMRRDAWVSANRSTLNLLRIPLFALLLAFLLRKETKRLYVEHLIFALHYQCFDFLRDLGSMVVRPLPILGWLLSGLLTLGGIVYFVMASQSVYKLPLKRLITVTIAFLILSTLAVYVTGFTAGIVYRLMA
jgi:hypothetical protein